MIEFRSFLGGARVVLVTLGMSMPFASLARADHDPFCSFTCEPITSGWTIGSIPSGCHYYYGDHPVPEDGHSKPQTPCETCPNEPCKYPPCQRG